MACDSTEKARGGDGAEVEESAGDCGVQAGTEAEARAPEEAGHESGTGEEGEGGETEA